MSNRSPGDSSGPGRSSITLTATAGAFFTRCNSRSAVVATLLDEQRSIQASMMRVARCPVKLTRHATQGLLVVGSHL